MEKTAKAILIAKKPAKTNKEAVKEITPVKVTKLEMAKEVVKVVSKVITNKEIHKVKEVAKVVNKVITKETLVKYLHRI